MCLTAEESSHSGFVHLENARVRPQAKKAFRFRGVARENFQNLTNFHCGLKRFFSR